MRAAPGPLLRVVPVPRVISEPKTQYNAIKGEPLRKDFHERSSNPEGMDHHPRAANHAA